MQIKHITLFFLFVSFSLISKAQVDSITIDSGLTIRYNSYIDWQADCEWKTFRDTVEIGFIIYADSIGLCRKANNGILIQEYEQQACNIFIINSEIRKFKATYNGISVEPLFYRTKKSSELIASKWLWK